MQRCLCHPRICFVVVVVISPSDQMYLCGENDFSCEINNVHLVAIFLQSSAHFKGDRGGGPVVV